MPGETSLYVTFNYKPEIVEILKQCEVYNYDKKTQTWEVPATSLHTLLDKFCLVDQVLLEFQEDTPEKPTELVQISQSYRTNPYPYQLEGITYGLNNPHWMLLDAPGLGKTLTTICLAEELKAKYNIEHCLVVCGLNTLKTNWKREIEMHSKYTARILGERVGKRSGKITYGGTAERLQELKKPIEEFFVITNIETLRNTDIIHELRKGKNKFDFIIVDEIHAAKNPQSQQGKNLLKLKAPYQVAMTGTVLMNSPVDAYVPLKWLGKETSNYSTFTHYYCNFGGPFGNELLGYRHMDILKEQMSKCSLRRTKDLLDLPPKTIIHEYVDMSDVQRKFYDDIKQGVIDEVDKVHMSTANLLAMVARLRQATACPSILTTSPIPSAKIDRAVDLATQILQNNEKVVIFSTFKDTLNEIAKFFLSDEYVLCTGDVKDSDIASNINRFQTDPNCKVMLATWQKMGTGITLTAASYAIFVDCAWTKAANLQAEDRIYRIGSKNPVFIYYLWCNDTIDLRVKDLVSQKEAIADYVVDDKVSDETIDSLKKYILELGAEKQL